MRISPNLRLVMTAPAAAGLLFLSACTTAEIKDVWTAPNLTTITFKKLLVIAASPDGKDGVSRRTAEDAIAKAMPSLQAVPSYTFLSEADLLDAAKSSAAINAAGFDGVIVMRMVSERTEVNVHPSWGYYGGYGYGRYGYGRHGYGRYYGGYGYGLYGYHGMDMGPMVTTDRIVSIETNIYESPSEKLLWSGAVESTSPGSITQMVDDTVGAVLEYMVKQKLIPAPVKK